MTIEDTTLRRQALRAYDLGRLRHAVRNAVVLVTPLLALSLYGCGAPAATIVLGSSLAALVALFTWRGGAWRRALGPGLLAGLVPFAIPVVAEITGSGCSGGNCRPLEIACVLGGLSGGAFLGWTAPRYPRSWHAPLAGAAGVAWLTGALGCIVLGTLGLTGVGLAILLAAAPVAVLRRA